MPYKSDAQRAFMHIHHPEIANKWDKNYPESAHSKSLPKHKKKTKEAALQKIAEVLSRLPVEKQAMVSAALERQAIVNVNTKLASYLDKQAMHPILNMLGSTLGGVAGGALGTSLGGPVGGMMGSQLGYMAANAGLEHLSPAEAPAAAKPEPGANAQRPASVPQQRNANPYSRDALKSYTGV